MDPNLIGIAAEYRVISELILRGLCPCRPLRPKGADLILENGLRVEIKGSRRYPMRNGYQCNLTLGHNHKKVNQDFYDYLICWCIDENVFYIIPREIIKATSKLSISLYQNTRYSPYREAWTLLEKGR